MIKKAFTSSVRFPNFNIIWLSLLIPGVQYLLWINFKLDLDISEVFKLILGTLLTIKLGDKLIDKEWDLFDIVIFVTILFITILIQLAIIVPLINLEIELAFPTNLIFTLGMILLLIWFCFDHKNYVRIRTKSKKTKKSSKISVDRMEL